MVRDEQRTCPAVGALCSPTNRKRLPMREEVMCRSFMTRSWALHTGHRILAWRFGYCLLGDLSILPVTRSSTPWRSKPNIKCQTRQVKTENSASLNSYHSAKRGLFLGRCPPGGTTQEPLSPIRKCKQKASQTFQMNDLHEVMLERVLLPVYLRYPV